MFNQRLNHLLRFRRWIRKSEAFKQEAIFINITQFFCCQFFLRGSLVLIFAKEKTGKISVPCLLIVNLAFTKWELRHQFIKFSSISSGNFIFLSFKKVEKRILRVYLFYVLTTTLFKLKQTSSPPSRIYLIVHICM